MNWEIAEDCSLVVPRFISDSEITNIAMSLEAVEVTLETHGAYQDDRTADGVEPITLKLVFDTPEYVAFKSDHLQNVVSDIFVFSGDELARAYDLEWFTEKSMLDDLRGQKFALFAVIQPTTGGDAVIAAQDLRIYEARHGTLEAE